MTENGNHAMHFGVECLEFKGSGQEIMNQYLMMAAQGKKDGFVPLILLKSKIIDETYAQEEDSGQGENSREAYRDMVLKEAEEIDVDALYPEERKGLNSPEFCEFMEDIEVDSEEDDEIQKELYLSSRGAETVLIAKVPAKAPWEVFGWIPFGGWNLCPEDSVLAAFSKKWYELYGAVPCAFGSDTLQYYLETPVSTEKAGELADEMFLFCSDIVLQGTGSIRKLKHDITGSQFWFFWWD